jgi:hypothetical protein
MLLAFTMPFPISQLNVEMLPRVTTAPGVNKLNILVEQTLVGLVLRI